MLKRIWVLSCARGSTHIWPCMCCLGWDLGWGQRLGWCSVLCVLLRNSYGCPYRLGFLLTVTKGHAVAEQIPRLLWQSVGWCCHLLSSLLPTPALLCCPLPQGLLHLPGENHHLPHLVAASPCLCPFIGHPRWVTQVVHSPSLLPYAEFDWHDFSKVPLWLVLLWLCSNDSFF